MNCSGLELVKAEEETFFDSKIELCDLQKQVASFLVLYSMQGFCLILSETDPVQSV